MLRARERQKVQSSETSERLENGMENVKNYSKYDAYKCKETHTHTSEVRLRGANLTRGK